MSSVDQWQQWETSLEFKLTGKLKELSECGLGWCGLCWPGRYSSDLSQDKPWAAACIFKRNIKINQAKRISKSGKAKSFSQKSSPCVIKFVQLKVNSLLSVPFMLRRCALGKPEAEMSFRPRADNFAVVIRQQESMWSDFREFGVN